MTAKFGKGGCHRTKVNQSEAQKGYVFSQNLKFAIFFMAWGDYTPREKKGGLQKCGREGPGIQFRKWKKKEEIRQNTSIAISKPLFVPCKRDHSRSKKEGERTTQKFGGQYGGKRGHKGGRLKGERKTRRLFSQELDSKRSQKKGKGGGKTQHKRKQRQGDGELESRKWTKGKEKKNRP